LNTQDGKKTVEIYNLANDPNEKVNLASSLPQLKTEFIQISISARVKSELFPLIRNGYDVDYTGLKSTFSKSSLDFIYPNPTKSIIRWSEKSEINRVIVYNISGLVVLKSEKLTTNSINLSKLKNGMYFLQLSKGNQVVHTGKFIKE